MKRDRDKLPDPDYVGLAECLALGFGLIVVARIGIDAAFRLR